MQRLCETLEDEGPTSFSQDDLARVEDLFLQRSALFYTPTENVPAKWVGQGPLDVRLPIPSPSYYEYREIYGYRSPRIWVDLLQRATGKLRWQPNSLSRVEFVRYDVAIHPYHVQGGIKGVLDALKVATTGRSDGRLLYYFGAILDDGPRVLSGYSFEQRIVPSPAEAGLSIRVRVVEASKGGANRPS